MTNAIAWPPFPLDPVSIGPGAGLIIGDKGFIQGLCVRPDDEATFVATQFSPRQRHALLLGVFIAQAKVNWNMSVLSLASGIIIFDVYRGFWRCQSKEFGIVDLDKNVQSVLLARVLADPELGPMYEASWSLMRDLMNDDTAHGGDCDDRG